MLPRRSLIAELQTRGMTLSDAGVGAPSRKGGAGPTDHKAVTIDGVTLMVPVHTHESRGSPFHAAASGKNGCADLYRDEVRVGTLDFPPPPRFYDLSTADGIPYWKIAQLHARDVLATTVLQNCFRYPDRETRCQFCAIGESLLGERTIAYKTPEQLAEVAEAAWRLDGVTHMVMTTGTPPTPDRGAAVLEESARAVKAATGLPIQVQCEPPDSFHWFGRLRSAGADSLGLHLEALDPAVRARIMPSKAAVPVAYYMDAFRAAVREFGRGQVSTYLLAGLGDSLEGLLEGCRKLIEIGIYPFVVPFVPIANTPLESSTPPSSEFMASVLEPLGDMLREAGMTSESIKAGCGRCGACSPQSTFES